MTFFRYLAVSLIGLYCSLSFSDTLIVTHPETRWDESNSTGQVTRLLLESRRFDKKIVLTTGHPFSFSSNGLSFKTVRSKIGDFKWRGEEPELFLAGGYFNACFFNSMTSIIAGSKSKKGLKLHVIMNATFISSERTESGEDYSTTLSSLQSEQPAEFEIKLKEFVDAVGTTQYWYAYNPNERLIDEDDPRIRNAYKIDFVLDGKIIATVGHGPFNVSIIFEK